ncbi:putative short-chain oxidoreductase [Mycena olivaceomarginata]|nr:putative short-chain oxidoreductase [Mycena olivaceomarginata]
MSEETAVILITGCSTGFGRALTEAALYAGLRVIATARRPETLVSLQEKGVKTLKLDVTASPEELKAFASTAIALFGKVDYLVNNAGFLQGGAIEETTAEENFAQFNTHVFGVINLTNAFLPHWRARRQGTIVNISSQGSMLCVPGGGIYCASKAALDAVSDTWARELAAFNIRSISLQPGAFRTSVAESGNMKTVAANIDGYDEGHAWLDMVAKRAGKERGDTEIAAAKIIELISVDPQRALPKRLVIGDDAYGHAQRFYERGLKDLETWKAFSTGTDAVDK